MKIDKRNPVHWLYLLLMGVNVLAAMLVRPLLHRRKTGRVLLYGHKRSGNLLAIHDRTLRRHPKEIEMFYLTMDPAYYGELQRQGVPCVLAISPSAIRWLATADAIISDHGLHAMRLMLGTTDMKFIDVWHGIPFKGFDADDFGVQQTYDEIWVASPLLASMYVERFGCEPRRIKVTGYARTDRLLAGGENERSRARKRIGLEGSGPVVLFAPTWKQDDKARNLFPFGLDEHSFCAALSQLARRHGATVVLRTHLNSGSACASGDSFSNIMCLPSNLYPDTESLLLGSDILICDWSSIAFDFLLLSRPTVFLDVDPPFSKGFSLDGTYRFGAIAGGLDSMLELLDRYLADPSRYYDDFGSRAADTRRIVYGGLDDGRCTERCLERLKTVIDANGHA